LSAVFWPCLPAGFFREGKVIAVLFSHRGLLQWLFGPVRYLFTSVHGDGSYWPGIDIHPICLVFSPTTGIHDQAGYLKGFNRYESTACKTNSQCHLGSARHVLLGISKRIVPG